MSVNGKSTQLKVIIGYMLFSLLLFFSINYIYHKIQTLTADDSYGQQLNEQRRVTYLFLTELYQAEIIGQSVSAGRADDFPAYRKAMRNALTALDSLQGILADSLQTARLDTVETLLRQKQQNMRNLLKALHGANAGQLYSQTIETVIRQQDTTFLQPKQVQKKVTVHEQSYVVPQKKKKSNFFQRLAEVFSSPKEDSTVVTNTKQEIVTDSLVAAYNPADTVTTILRTIQTQVNDSILHVQDAYRQRIERFRRSGWELSNRLNQLLQTFEEAEQQHIEKRIALEQNVNRKSVRIIGVVAIAAIILVAAFLFMIERDITRSNHYRQELEKAKQRAEALLVAREKLMLTITHDIKAPTGSILGYIDLLKRLLADERQRFYLQNMKSSAQHLLDLVNSLLDFHRLEAHKMEISRVPFNPRQLFETIQASFRPLAEQKGLQLTYKADARADGFFLGDPFRIRQIADNLLSNALKFTQEGSITLTTRWTDGVFCFTVQDTGSGISEEEQQRMFQEFTRLKNAQGEEGFGLGLAITQRLVTLMQGHIQLESRPGAGSTFTVGLPLELASEEPCRPGVPTLANNPFDCPSSSVQPGTSIPTDNAPAQSANDHTPHFRGKLRLIFIDDDRIQLDLTQAMLQHPQLEVTCCQSPEQLFGLLAERPYDLLFTDIQMPALNGFELLKQLRASEHCSNRRLPVVALTARNDMDGEQFRSQGFAAHLHKPYTQSEVLALIHRITGHRLTIQPIGTNKDATKTATPFINPANTSTAAQATSTAATSPFNFAALTAFSANDPEAAHAILQSFVNETRHNRECLADALQQQNCQQIRTLAHKQIPLFSLLEATECLPILVWLEREEYDHLTPTVARRATQVLQHMDIILKEAEEYLCPT